MAQKESLFIYHLCSFFPGWRIVSNQRKVSGFEPSFPTDYNSGVKERDLRLINSHFLLSLSLPLSFPLFLLFIPLLLLTVPFTCTPPSPLCTSEPMNTGFLVFQLEQTITSSDISPLRHSTAINELSIFFFIHSSKAGHSSLSLLLTRETYNFKATPMDRVIFTVKLLFKG